MKEIQLTQGRVALVDDCDYEYLNQFKWHTSRDRSNIYAKRHEKGRHCERKTIKMHRLILGVTDSRIQVDHKDSNGLNNQRSNLRICTNSENQYNQRVKFGGTSAYKGVSFSKKRNKWVSQIRASGKDTYLGGFADEIEAARAYDIEAKKNFKEFANLNFK